MFRPKNIAKTRQMWATSAHPIPSRLRRGFPGEPTAKTAHVTNFSHHELIVQRLTSVPASYGLRTVIGSVYFTERPGRLLTACKLHTLKEVPED